ncbi:methyl-accepting chemotaxis protein [Pelagerythrobacter marensis]|uniref:Methyl-accepting chemotaxis protein n=1 Tax=Pelagerythrobacter marensis TaxID=543877 RepID=A0ABZ2D950_9SPHN
MNAETTIIVPDEMREEIDQVVLDETARPVSPGRSVLVRRFNDQSLGRKLTILCGVPLVALAALAALAWIGLGSTDRDFAESLRWPIVTVTAMLIVAGIGAIGIVMKDTSNQLRKLAKDMTALAAGHRDFAIAGLERRDEIGEIARAFEVFVKSGRKLDEMFANRRVERERRQEEMRALVRSFETNVGHVVNGVGTAAVQLKATASSMASAAEKGAEQTSRVAQAMAEASSGVTAAAAASDEFAMSIGEISRQAAQSAELAREATGSTQTANDTISALSKTAEEIGHVVGLISTIAQRTNLLALNASIEAARGGEAGRGFAVVASEVKELAAQTGRATEQVAQQIQAIQDSTGASVSALQVVAEQVQQLESTAISIASAVDQQSVAGQELARNIDLTARGTSEVRSNVEKIRETALSTGAAASQVLSSATELEGQASTLRSQVARILEAVHKRS